MMALLAGLGAGYLGYKEKERDNKRQDEKDQREKEVHDAKMEEYRKTKADQSAVADTYSATQSDAYTPAQGQELDAIANAKDADGKPYYAVGNDPAGKYTVTPNFQNETGAKPQAYAPATIAAKGVNYLGKSYDQPLTDEQAMGARRTRIADLAAQGSTIASTALDRDQKTVKFDQEQQDRLRIVQKEGLIDVEEAMRLGDAAGMKEKFNRSGDFKIVSDVVMTPEKRTIPGYGDIDTFTYTFDLQGKDGAVQKVSRNSFDMSQAIMPYAKQIEAMRAGKKDAADIANKEAQTAEHTARASYLNGGGAAGAKASDKPYRMDEDDKIRIKDAATSVRDAEKMVNDAMKVVVPGEDPTKSPAVMHAQGVLRQAKRGQFVAHIQTGVVTPEMLAAKIIGVANTKEDVFKSLKELADDVGAEYADQVAARLHGNDKWTALSAPPAQPKPKASTAQQPAQAAAPAQIAAQGVQPPRRDFYAEQKAAAERGLLAKQAAAQARAAQAIEQDRAMEEKRKAYLAARGTTPRATLANTYNFPR